MKQEYKEAFSEVNEIIKMMPEELSNKIPNKFKELLENERAMEYQPNIQEPLEEQKLKNETIIILGLIYRDFLCSSDEKKKLQEKDAREFQELQELEKAIEEEMRVKFNPDEIFKKRNTTDNQQVEECKSMTVIEEKWYKKIFNIIKNFFNRKNWRRK